MYVFERKGKFNWAKPCLPFLASQIAAWSQSMYLVVHRSEHLGNNPELRIRTLFLASNKLSLSWMPCCTSNKLVFRRQTSETDNSNGSTVHQNCHWIHGWVRFSHYVSFLASSSFLFTPAKAASSFISFSFYYFWQMTFRVANLCTYISSQQKK